MKKIGMVLTLLLLVGCGGGGGGGDNSGGGGISGEWSGNINDGFAGEGTLTMSLITDGTDFLGTFSMQFQSPLYDLSGDITGFEVSSPRINFYGTNYTPCVLSGIGTRIGGHWNSSHHWQFSSPNNCPVNYTGSFSVIR